MFFAAGQLQAALSAVGAPPSLAFGRFGLAGNVAGYVLELFEQLREAINGIADLVLKGDTLLEIFEFVQLLVFAGSKVPKGTRRLFK